MSNLKPSEVLSTAADLIEPEGRWTQKAYGRDEQGSPVWVPNRRTCCLCAVGALFVASRYPMSIGAVEHGLAARLLAKVIGGSITPWNDKSVRTQAQVVAALRKAADLARAEEAA